MYSIYVIYKAKKGQREAFLNEANAKGIPAMVRAEDGCIRYDYYLPLDKADEILLLEKWETKEKQQIHVAQPHMAELRAIKEKYIDDTIFGEFEIK